ncbi:hypothetical protein [Hyperthermus butylicus]|uniref:Uncharacterized protein n=1 Tax=Hyperthermus butylicus (strain DSM 5456 / JCM 9403 / PLM1-5) TaxID=415426 RepID=A2BM69_HYPBU|nr:hypothetical protein [Hyperthermus butylicus]ABM81080.1 hypothetical protein Hbut_1248 [Hyperthermus butylicus DSM 5456]
MALTREELKARILDIVENAPQMNKAAFYSDPYVEKLLEELQRRWEESGYQGEPIDHASDEELERLYRLALEYANMPEWKAYRLFLERTTSK